MAASVNSDVATLHVGFIADAQTPDITEQPMDIEAEVNDSVTLSVAAEVKDGGTLSYQWYSNKDAVNTEGALISGAVDANYSPSTTNPGTTYYYVTIINTNSNVTGNQTASVTSNAAKVTVNAAPLVDAQTPRITGQPNGGTVDVNSSITLSVATEVRDGGTLTYQWYRNNSNNNNRGTLIHGATSRTYAPPTGNEGTTFYYVAVTNTNSNATGDKTATATSFTARVVVNALVNAQTPNIATQPKGGAVKANDSITLSVSAEVNDRGSVSYQWYRNGRNSNANGTRIGGATHTTYEPPTDAAVVTYYYVVVTNTNNGVSGEKTASVASTVVTVAVYTTPGTPQNLKVVIEDDKATLRWAPPESDGGSAITGYQVSDDNGANWTEAVEKGEHTFTGLAGGIEYAFRVRAVNAAGNGTEAVLTSEVAEGIVSVTGVTLDKATLDIFEGERALLEATVEPEDADDLSVTWKSNDIAVATVDDHGVVTAQAEGSTVITVTTHDGGHNASCIVTVESASQPAEVSGSVNLVVIWIIIIVVVVVAVAVIIYMLRKKRR